MDRRPTDQKGAQKRAQQGAQQRAQQRDTEGAGEPVDVPRLDELSDGALNQLAEDVPDLWLDVTAGDGSIDDGELAELLGPIGSEAEERLAKSVVEDFLRDGQASALADDPVFMLGAPSDPPIRTGALNVAVLRPRAEVDRSWWGIGLPLVAAAIVLIVLVDGPGLSAVFDDEGRVRPANLTPNATASAKGARERAKWPAELPVPGSPSGITGASAETPAEVELSRGGVSVPGGLPGGVPGGVRGGVVGGVVGGVAGGAVGVPGGTAGESILSEEMPAVLDARPSTPSGERTPKKSALGRPALARPLVEVMAKGVFTPDPDPVALGATKAGLFDRRPCTSVIAFCVDREGRAVEVRSEGRCYDPQVDEVCVNTVKKWRFRPFVVEGEAAAVCTEVAFDLRFGKRR